MFLLQISEGMSLALLEAMAVGVPVSARRNSGNVALIDDGKTGFLFSTPAEFVTIAQHLIEGK